MFTILATVIGVALVATAAADALNTLVTTRLQSGRLWPTELYYRSTWIVWRSVARRLKEGQRRETFLSIYGPLSLLGLLVMWITLQILGWGFLWWAHRSGFDAIGGLGEAIYFSGVSFFTVGFGDVIPTEGFTRALVLIEAFAGLGTTALVIGYLPTLYGAYSARETQLLMLDSMHEERVVPFDIARVELHGGIASLNAFFAEWERWVARLLESHTSYPMLTLFRSQHVGQSWVTALGVVTDLAAGSLAAFRDVDVVPAELLLRRSTRTLQALCERLPVDVDPDQETITRDMFAAGYENLSALGIPVRSLDETWERLEEYRRLYAPQMEALIDYTLAPRGFWSIPVDEREELPEAADARFRADD